MDADIANLSTATVKVVVDGGHGHRNGDTVIFRTVLHPWLNGTYEGITVIDESTFVFSWKNNTGGTVSPIIDFTDGTVTKLMSQRVYRGGGWDSTTADDARVFARDHEPLTNVAMATTSSLAAVYTPGLAGGGIGDSLVSVNSRSLLIDGQSPEVGDRVLVKDQATPAENGIYIVTNTGSAISSYILTRDSAFDEGSELPSSNKQWVSVRAGALNAKSVWKVSVEATPTVGTSPITYAIQPGYFSTGLGFRVVKLQQ
jgi:hypothetical protein